LVSAAKLAFGGDEGSTWLSAIKAKIDARADHGPTLSVTEKLLLLRAARLVTRLEQVEMLASVLNGDLADSSADARSIYFATATDLRHTVTMIEQWGAAA
jgi:hypothetical protein